MKELEIGETLRIHCYKHNGKIHRAWDEATVIYSDDEVLVCANNRTKVTESDGRNYRTKEPEVMIFYKNHWFNVYAQLKKKGLFYKCNIASPYIIDDEVIKFIDYDLDLKVFPDGGFKVLDRNEYKYHSNIMNYPKELDKIVADELTELINLKRENKYPFNKEKIYEFYEIYKNIKKL